MCGKLIYCEHEANTQRTIVLARTQLTVTSPDWKKNAKTQVISIQFMNMRKHVYIAHLIPFVFVQKIDNRSLWRMVHEPFTDGATLVHSPVHINAHVHTILFASVY